MIAVRPSSKLHAYRRCRGQHLFLAFSSLKRIALNSCGYQRGWGRLNRPYCQQNNNLSSDWLFSVSWTLPCNKREQAIRSRRQSPPLYMGIEEWGGWCTYFLYSSRSWQGLFSFFTVPSDWRSLILQFHRWRRLLRTEIEDFVLGYWLH